MNTFLTTCNKFIYTISLEISISILDKLFKGFFYSCMILKLCIHCKIVKMLEKIKVCIRERGQENIVDEAKLQFPNYLILFVLLLPHVGEHYHEEELGHFCWLWQAVFRETLYAFRLTLDNILRLWLFLLVSRNCSWLLLSESTIQWPRTFFDGTQATANALVPRSC